MKAKWLVLALAVSLAANAALVGYLVGKASRPASWHRGAFDPVAGLPRLLDFLPRERRRELMELHPRGPLRTALHDMRRAQRAMDQALATEPFDAEALAAALAQYRAHFAAGQERSHAMFLAIAGQLTAEERRRFIKGLRLRDGSRKQPGRNLDGATHQETR